MTREGELTTVGWLARLVPECRVEAGSLSGNRRQSPSEKPAKTGELWGAKALIGDANHAPPCFACRIVSLDRNESNRRQWLRRAELPSV